LPVGVYAPQNLGELHRGFHFRPQKHQRALLQFLQKSKNSLLPLSQSKSSGRSGIALFTDNGIQLLSNNRPSNVRSFLL
jgi:hypothetical protein